MGLPINHIFTAMTALFAAPHGMPPLGETKQQRHSLDYGVRINHPTSYDENPPFKGPLVLKEMASPEFHRRRIRGYYLRDDNLKHYVLGESSKSSIQLSASASTATIIKSIIDHLARKDAPLDAKELAESTEFYLRSAKRLLGAARRVLKNRNADAYNIIIHDMCSGHGLTGMLFVACNPPRGKSMEHVRVFLVDQAKPQSHDIVRDIITEVCPWVTKDSVKFIESSLNDYTSSKADMKTGASIIISTHACGSLTDDVLRFSVGAAAAAAAVMPCCYTGTDAGVPWGIRRVLGVSLSADTRRCFDLQNNGYHVDFATIPKAVTPMNRIIIAERRK